MDDASIQIFNETIDGETMVKAILGSASLPVALPTVELMGMHLVDGGVFTNLDLYNAIQRCKEITDNEAEIIVDVIMCQSNPIKIPQFDESSPFEAMRLWFRSFQFIEYYLVMDDVIQVVEAHPDVNFRYMVVPSQKLT